MSYQLRGKSVLTIEDLKGAFGARWHKNLPTPDAIVGGLPVWSNAGDSLLKARAKCSGLWAQILIDVPEEAVRRLRYTTDAPASLVRAAEYQANKAWSAVNGPHRPTKKAVGECLNEVLAEWALTEVGWAGPSYDGVVTFGDLLPTEDVRGALFALLCTLTPEETLRFLAALVEALRALNRK